MGQWRPSDRLRHRGVVDKAHGLSDPSTLKNDVETLAFGHLALDVTVPRVVIFRDAHLDLFQVGLGNKLTVEVTRNSSLAQLRWWGYHIRQGFTTHEFS